MLAGLLAAGCGGRILAGDASGEPVDDPAIDDEMADPWDDPALDVTDDEQVLACDGLARIVSEKGDLAPGMGVTDVSLGWCEEHRYTFVAVEGGEVMITVMAHGHDRIVLEVLYPDDLEIVEIFESVTGGVPDELVFSPPRSGEFVVAVHASRPDATEVYDLSVSCASGCDLVATRFPIVLVHGWTGFESIGPITYFWNVPETLVEQGFLVYVASLDPYNSVDVRSEQLASQVDGFLTRGRARKVDIVAHSQGGLDSRRLVSTLGYGDRVSALVTISTPHRGTPITDIALGALPGPGEDALYFLLELIGATAVGSESDARASFASMTTGYVEGTFNPENPDDPLVQYVSYAGLTCPLGITCGDVCDVEIAFSYDLIYLAAGDNDGIVPVSSAVWGDYRGEVAADHFDEVGQLFGVTGPNFDHLQFYSDVARELASEGH